MSDSYLPFRTDYNRWSDPSRDESPVAWHPLTPEAPRQTKGFEVYRGTMGTPDT